MAVQKVNKGAGVRFLRAYAERLRDYPGCH